MQAPFKIFSTLIRALDNEMAPTRQDKDPLKEKQKNGNGKKKKNSSDFNGLDDDDNNFDDNVVDEEDEEGSDDGPIEIADNDEDYNDILKNSGNKPSDTDKDNQNKVQVNMEGIKDEEDENDIQKRFSVIYFRIRAVAGLSRQSRVKNFRFYNGIPFHSCPSLLFRSYANCGFCCNRWQPTNRVLTPFLHPANEKWARGRPGRPRSWLYELHDRGLRIYS